MLFRDPVKYSLIGPKTLCRPEDGQQMSLQSFTLIEQPSHNFATDGEDNDIYMEFPERPDSAMPNPVREALPSFRSGSENQPAWTSAVVESSCLVRSTAIVPNQTIPRTKPFQSPDEAGCRRLSDSFLDGNVEDHIYECLEDLRK